MTPRKTFLVPPVHRYAGVDQDGNRRYGDVPFADVELFVRSHYARGWKTLSVRRDSVYIAGIEGTAYFRQWWVQLQDGSVKQGGWFD